MVRKRNERKQIYTHKDFAEALERIKAQSILEGVPIKSIPDLTKELLKTRAFKDVVKELLNQNRNIEVTLKIDKRKI